MSTDNTRDEYRGLAGNWQRAVLVANLWAQESGRRMRIFRAPVSSDIAWTFPEYASGYGWRIREVDAPPSLGERLAAAHIADAKARAGLEVTA